VLSGDDANTVTFMALGGEASISVAANQVPGPMHDLVAACARGDFAEGPPHPLPAAPPDEPELRGVEPHAGEGRPWP
jgi:hypothetical protein